MKGDFEVPTGAREVRSARTTNDKIERKIWEKLMRLPLLPEPKGSYMPVLRQDKTLYVSGQLPIKDNSLGSFVGRHGREITTDAGKRAAQLCTLNALAFVKKELGSLEKIERVLKLTAYVAGMPGFDEQAVVANGASDFLIELYGNAGRHARTVVGVTDLPLGACIEIDYLFHIK